MEDALAQEDRRRKEDVASKRPEPESSMKNLITRVLANLENGDGTEEGAQKADQEVEPATDGHNDHEEQ